MNLRRWLPDWSSIATRLMAWFLALAVVPCLFLLALTLFFSQRALEAIIRLRLVGISNYKAAEVEQYIGERRVDAEFLANAPGFVEVVVELERLAGAGRRDTPEYRTTVEGFQPRLTAFADPASYQNLVLLDLAGAPLMAHRPWLDVGPGLMSGPLARSELAESFQRSRSLLQPVVSNYQLYPGRTEPSAFVVGPMFRGGVLIGSVVLELNNAVVFRPFGSYFGLGETGDITVAMEVDDGAVYVAPTRFDAGTAFRDRIRLGVKEGQDMQLAIRGGRGYAETLDHTGRPVVTSWTYLPSFRWGMTVKQATSEAYELLSKQRQGALLFMLAAVAVVVVVARAVARTISGPIRQAARLAEKVASGDLTAQDVPVASGEAGQLLRAIEAMTGDLRSLIGRVQQSSIALMSTATEIAATSRQQGEAVSDYGASTSEAAAAVNEITATSLELLKTMNEVNGVAGQTAELAAEGQGSLAEMGRSMRQLAESTTSVGSKLSVISERAAHINLAVTTIAKVADQTNLLSINAAIEAEKAGEYGLGFLVVAREIRRLADQTAVATLDIERMVKEMQYSVSAGVMEMDKFSDQVRRGVDEVAQIGDQLGRIIAAVQGLTGQFDQVNEGMRVQSQGAEQIREAVIRLSEGAHQTSISLREFNKATDHLRQAVGGLKEEVSRFTVDRMPLDRPAG